MGDDQRYLFEYSQLADVLVDRVRIGFVMVETAMDWGREFFGKDRDQVKAILWQLEQDGDVVVEEGRVVHPSDAEAGAG